MNTSNSSIWDYNKYEYKPKKQLTGNITADVAVIGAGMAGILTAYKLQKRGLKVVVIEAKRVGFGVTKNTTAKITSQHNIIYSKLINSYGINFAKAYALANENAIYEYKRIIEDHNIDCSFEQKNAFVYSNCDKDIIRREFNSAVMCGIDAFYTEESDLPFKIKAAVGFRNQAQFNPLKFLFSIANELQIYENTTALDIKNGCVITDRGTVKATHIAVCTHYPFLKTTGLYFARMHQDRSYVIATKANATIDGMYVCVDDNGYSFRQADGHILIGGSSHRTGVNKNDCYKRLVHASKLYYPRASITNRWSAQDCVSIDNIPFIGRYSTSLPRVYVATGFNKWGMSLSMVSADIICDLIMTNKSKYEKVFSPQRFNLPQSHKNIKENIKYTASGMFEKYFRLPKDKIETIKKGCGTKINYNGKKIGVYKDEKGQIYAVSIICPHLGCELNFNSEDKSWDCPCHGSRFNIYGEKLDNPANSNLTRVRNQK